MVPVLLSPLLNKSEEVFEYEKPTPTGESRNNIFAAAKWKTSWKCILIIPQIFCNFEISNMQKHQKENEKPYSKYY